LKAKQAAIKYIKTEDLPAFTARCTLVQSAVLRSHVVCPSVRLWVRPSVTLWIGITYSVSQKIPPAVF